MMAGITSVAFDPMLPWTVLAGLGAVAALLVLYGLWQRVPGTVWRLATFTALLALLADPSLVSEQRESRPDVGVIVVDQSPSQAIGDRQDRTEQAVNHLQEQFKRETELEMRVVRVDGSTDRDGGTRLLAPLERALSDVPPQRVAGVVLVTDGQVHDADTELRAAIAPVHVLLSGNKAEKDRRLVVVKAPRYGIVGEQLTMTVRIVDQGYDDVGRRARITVRRPDGRDQAYDMRVGTDHDIPLTLEHAGSTVVELSVESAEEELTLRNNRAVVLTNGVRDRLRVLLVSGKPHSGERTWRNLLKADPSVDLVHFTILRPPEKQDGTPINELSLIAFPIRELFEVKLEEFDLIIFDRYHRRGVLPSVYLDNIAEFVRDGGALLEAAGPSFASPLSLYRTPLEGVLPGRPSGNVFEVGFRPSLTEIGFRHPVTAELRGAGAHGENNPTWGRWFRMIEADAMSGRALMHGISQKPVLILDRVGTGRVAQLLSDQSWLWARGFEGGGPQAELLRRLAHWLMKEPDLEEEKLTAQARNERIDIERRTLSDAAAPVTVTGPSGQTWQVELADQGLGRTTGRLEVTEPGIYRLTDGTNQAVAAVGGINPLEYQDVRATEAPLAALTEASDGGVVWLAEQGLPTVRRIRPGRDAHGNGWIGVKANKDYLVTGVRQTDLLPPVVTLILVAAAMILAWRREGR